MKQAKHTPGKWRVSEDELGHGEYDILAKKEGFPNIGVATVVDSRFSNYNLGSVALHKDECSANAHLIAAAPELLEACKMVVDVFNLHLYKTDSGGGKCYAKAQTAIAKAEGSVK